MLKRFAPISEFAFLASDLVVVSLSLLFSYWFRFRSGAIEVPKGIPDIDIYVWQLLFVWFIWPSVFRRAGLYRQMRGMRAQRELVKVIKANTLCILILLSITYLFREKSVEYSRYVFVIFGVFSTVFLLASRAVVRAILRSVRRRGMNLRYALVVGNGRLARQIHRRIKRHPEFGIEVIGSLSRPSNFAGPHGFIDASAEVQPRSSTLKVLGCYSDVQSVLDEHTVDQVIISVPLADHQYIPEIVTSIGDRVFDVKIIPDLQQFIQLGSFIDDLDGLPVVSLASTPLVGVNRILKRLVDIALGGILFLLALPIVLFFAGLVLVTSGRPVFYKQERMGLDGKLFRIYKIRTMKRDAEVAGAVFATKGDNRTTWLGKFLRRFSIDELPQLFNVLRGDMSLVGPRPERPIFIDEFRQRVPKYMLRHTVQAGMTGWAQVNGWRGDTSIEKRIEHDLYYIENWSLGLDMKILFRTVFAALVDRNAY